MTSIDTEMTPGESKIDNDQTFDFEKWIQSNELEPVKTLLNKHNLTTIDSLSHTSSHYFELLSDPALLQQKATFIPKIHQAIQYLDDFLVISEAEKCVRDKLEQHLVQLDKIETDMKQLKKQYPESIERINKERDSQVEQARKTINDTFDKIKHELAERQKELLNELSKFKEGNTDIDDLKEMDLFDEVSRHVESQKTKIKNNLKLCEDTLIRQKNKEVQKRKEIILNAGNKCDEECNSRIESIEKNKQKVQELINKNNEYIVNISCDIKCKDLLTKIQNLGVIENCEQDMQNNNEGQEYAKEYSSITDDPFEEKENQSNELKYNIIIKSLAFSKNSQYRWCNEEKEQYITVKILDKNEKTYITSNGMMKTADEVSCKMANTVSVTELCKWLSVMKGRYEFEMNKINWRFDHWDSKLKHEYIKQLTGDVIETSSNLVWFRSIFGSKICTPSFTYHWKLQQQTESPQDFYVGVEQAGKELVDTYFYKSQTSYAFSGHNHTLYANGNLTNDKCIVDSHVLEQCCSKRWDIIDVYLELVEHHGRLSFAVNGKKCAKAYYVKPGEYRLAVCMNGISRIKLVYSSKREGVQGQDDDQEEDQTEFV